MESLSLVQEQLRAGLGLEHAAFVLIGSAALGLLVTLLLWVALRRASPQPRPREGDPDPGSGTGTGAGESKKRSRRRGLGPKSHSQKVPRNLEDGAEPAPTHNPGEGPGPARPDKAKKNKKKLKAAAKEPETSSSPSERKEQEEAVGSWETKVSHREKRQQKKKDRGGAEDSPGGAGRGPGGSDPEPAPVVQEPRTAVAPATGTAKPSKNNKADGRVAVATPATPEKEVVPVVGVAAAAIIPPAISQVWDDALPSPFLPDPFSGVSVTVEIPGVTPHTWNSRRPEPSVWPQDMEGSWTIVDSSRIPVSFHGLSGGVEPAFVPDLSWACHPPMDDEWSGLNSACAEPGSDWSAPCEEWGNFEGVAPHLEEPQESDPEKATPGGGTARRRRKKKKKVEEAGTAAQERGHAPPSAPPPRVAPGPAELEAPPTLCESPGPVGAPTPDAWESPRQVKKKKARRET